MATKKTKLEAAKKYSATRVSMFNRHHLKVLNLGLILYLCFGSVLFDLLSFDEISHGEQRFLGGSSKQADQRESKTTTNGSKTSGMTTATMAKVKVSLEELRLNSARRMWNITNQLNILYESNWTLLVIDELVEFERQLVNALSSVMSKQEDEGDDVELPDLELEERDGKKVSEDARSAREAKRSKSIKRSIVHSLTTITTIGSPQVEPQNKIAKLATMLYAAFGIPLLFFTVAQTGKQMAHSATNSLLAVSHYAFSLPIHYLCCAFNPYLCFRLLSWCCCCCCCSYLFCPNKNKRKCCDTEGAPKLKLGRRQGRRQRRPDSARESRADQTIKLQNDPSIRREIGFIDQNQQQKSVRFNGANNNNNNNNNSQCNLQDYGANYSDESDDDYDYDDIDKEIYSFTLLVSSLIIFALYFSLGAYFYAHHQNTSLIDASYACYSMLSTSQLPESFGSNADESSKVNSLAPSYLYETLKLEAVKTVSKEAPMLSDKQSSTSLSNEALIWQAIYLICGLNLISMCAHYAKLWMEGRQSRQRRQLEEKEVGERQKETANGHIAATYLSGSFGAAGTGAFLEASPMRRLHDDELTPSNVQVQSEAAPGGYIMAQTADHQLVGASMEISPSQHSEQLNLAELYVVNNGGSQQQTSDMSFTSDRSTTDRGSLCLHHQAAVQSLPMNSGGGGGGGGVQVDVAYPAAAIYTHHQVSCSPNQHNHNHHQHHHHHHHLSQKHLYLANSAAANERQVGQQGDFRLDELDDDDNEMDRMLKTCINGGQSVGGKMRPSSSLIQLSQQTGPSFSPRMSNMHLASNGLAAHKQVAGDHYSKTLNRVATKQMRPMETLMNGSGEHDNNLNAPDTSSNTMSSVSSRTVKITLPRRQTASNRIGFMINDESDQ